ADHDRELAQAGVGEVLAVERLVGRAEVDGRGLDLRDAAAGTDRLVVDLVAGLRGERGRPLGEHRIDERGACAGDVGGISAARGERQNRGGGKRRHRATELLEHDEPPWKRSGGCGLRWVPQHERLQPDLRLRAGYAGTLKVL